MITDQELYLFEEENKEILQIHDKRILDKAREMTVPEEKTQLDKNDPDNYEACFAIHGFNDCRQKSISLWDKYIKEV